MITYKQNLWIIYLVLGILGAIGGIIYVWHIIEQYWWQILIILGAILLISKYYREKISPRLHRLYEAVKSKMPKRVPTEELEKITKEIERLKNEMKEIKFKPEIKGLTAEKGKKLLVSCTPVFLGHSPPSIKFKFEIDNRFDQSFLLDRILYEARARETETNCFLCEDACLERVEIKGNKKTPVSKTSLVTNLKSLDRINEYVMRGEYKIDWMIDIKIFFERGDGLKLFSDTILSTTDYSDWKRWYKKWKEEQT